MYLKKWVNFFFVLGAGAEFFYSSGASAEPEPIFFIAPEPKPKKSQLQLPAFSMANQIFTFRRNRLSDDVSKTYFS